jgi:hypothetical protein
MLLYSVENYTRIRHTFLLDLILSFRLTFHSSSPRRFAKGFLYLRHSNTIRASSHS